MGVEVIADLDTDRSVAALRRTTCCGCGGPLPQRGPLNVILLDKRADWHFPTHGSVLVDGSGGRAVAVLCHYCLHEDVAPKTAVEVVADGSIRHHPIDRLVELPEITGADLR